MVPAAEGEEGGGGGHDHAERDEGGPGSQTHTRSLDRKNPGAVGFREVKRYGDVKKGGPQAPSSGAVERHGGYCVVVPVVVVGVVVPVLLERAAEPSETTASPPPPPVPASCTRSKFTRLLR